MSRRFFCGALLAAVFGCLMCAPAHAFAPNVRSLGSCSWSFFGDPRTLTHGDTSFTGCVSNGGVAYVVRTNLRTGAQRRFKLYRFSWVDDHNNPSVVLWHARVCAFFSPHSGHELPKDRHMFMAYRCSTHRYGLHGGFGRAHYVPLGKGCGLGYTYPNLVRSGRRLYVFMRGPCWEPYYTSTTDLRHWSSPRTLVLGAYSAIHKQRPYAKYAAGPAGSIDMTFSDGHPQSFTTSLRYMRMKGGRFYKANGRLIGTVRDLPFHAVQLDTPYRYTAAPGGGKAWPMDVATDKAGDPVIVYTRLRYGDTYWYARWDGEKWLNTAITGAGSSYGEYHNAGASLNHDDPSWVVLGKNTSGLPAVELWHTPDGGTTWQSTPVSTESHAANYRPIFVRGFHAPGKLAIEYVSGLAPTFLSYHTHVVLRIVPAQTAQSG